MLWSIMKYGMIWNNMQSNEYKYDIVYRDLMSDTTSMFVCNNWNSQCLSKEHIKITKGNFLFTLETELQGLGIFLSFFFFFF